MIVSNTNRDIPLAEFISLIAMMVSIMALATDIMLPALGHIGKDLLLDDDNKTQLIVSMLFLGLMVGQLIAGPLSDQFGRRPVIHSGFAVFMLGCLVSALATTFEVMLIGRVLQGLGAAAPRIVSLAIVRDGYTGRTMARIMSIVMSVFMLVPAIAPLIGEGILFIGSWRSTFTGLFLIAVVGWVWFAVRQPESLMVEHRQVLSGATIVSGIKHFFGSRPSVGYTLATGFIFGAFLGYLSLAQQVFQQTYKVGLHFALWFSVASLAIAAASAINASLVVKMGMKMLTVWALIILSVVSAAFICVVLLMENVPPFWSFMLWMFLSFACIGMVFGNLNALAMEPLGEIAGMGAALVGSLSTLVSLPLAWLMGRGYDGGIDSLVAGFAVLAMAALITTCITERALPWEIA